MSYIRVIVAQVELIYLHFIYQGFKDASLVYSILCIDSSWVLEQNNCNTF